MDKLELSFTYQKETKNTVRYREELSETAHTSRDQKEVLGQPVPQRLRVPKRGVRKPKIWRFSFKKRGVSKKYP